MTSKKPAGPSRTADTFALIAAGSAAARAAIADAQGVIAALIAQLEGHADTLAKERVANRRRSPAPMRSDWTIR